MSFGVRRVGKMALEGVPSRVVVVVAVFLLRLERLTPARVADDCPLTGDVLVPF